MNKKHIIGAIIQITGYTLLINLEGWLVAICLALIILGNNLEQSK